MMRFAVMIAALAALLTAGEVVQIEKNVPVSIQYKAGKPIAVSFNFFVKKAGIIQKGGGDVENHLLPKGLILIPEKETSQGILTVVNDIGNTYIIEFAPGGGDSAFSFEDPIYEFNHQPTLSPKPVSSNIVRECNSLVRRIVRGKSIKGYILLNAPLTINIREKGSDDIAMVLNRTKRFAGKKYIVEQWIGKNVSPAPKYIDPEDYYTRGIIAISPSQRYVDPQESFDLIIVINKATLKDYIEGGNHDR